MSKLVKSLLFLMGLALSVSASAVDLTEKSVKDALNKMDQAVNQLDADKLATGMSDNVEIIMNVTMQGQTQVMKPNKQQYIAMLKQGWAATTDYKYSRTNVKVKMQGKKAVVTADINEVMTIQGQKIAGDSKEEATVEMVNGKVLVTKIVGHTSM